MKNKINPAWRNRPVTPLAWAVEREHLAELAIIERQARATFNKKEESKS